MKRSNRLLKEEYFLDGGIRSVDADLWHSKAYESKCDRVIIDRSADAVEYRMLMEFHLTRDQVARIRTLAVDGKLDFIGDKSELKFRTSHELDNFLDITEEL